MNIHIVKVNEKIERIANIYNLSKYEIIKLNHHIQDWEHLVPGTKLRLPEIPENVEIELENVEPFIEEYYPKIDANELLLKKEEVIEEPVLSQNNDKEKKTTNQKNKYHQYPYNSYYPYYGYYNGYPPYNYYRRSKKKKTK